MDGCTAPSSNDGGERVVYDPDNLVSGKPRDLGSSIRRRLVSCRTMERPGMHTSKETKAVQPSTEEPSQPTRETPPDAANAKLLYSRSMHDRMEGASPVPGHTQPATPPGAGGPLVGGHRRQAGSMDSALSSEASLPILETNGTANMAMGKDPMRSRRQLHMQHSNADSTYMQPTPPPGYSSGSQHEHNPSNAPRLPRVSAPSIMASPPLQEEASGSVGPAVQAQQQLSPRPPRLSSPGVLGGMAAAYAGTGDETSEIPSTSAGGVTAKLADTCPQGSLAASLRTSRQAQREAVEQTVPSLSTAMTHGSSSSSAHPTQGLPSQCLSPGTAPAAGANLSFSFRGAAVPSSPQSTAPNSNHGRSPRNSLAGGSLLAAEAASACLEHHMAAQHKRHSSCGGASLLDGVLWGQVLGQPAAATAQLCAVIERQAAMEERMAQMESREQQLMAIIHTMQAQLQAPTSASTGTQQPASAHAHEASNSSHSSDSSSPSQAAGIIKGSNNDSNTSSSSSSSHNNDAVQRAAHTRMQDEHIQMLTEALGKAIAEATALATRVAVLEQHPSVGMQLLTSDSVASIGCGMDEDRAHQDRHLGSVCSISSRVQPGEALEGVVSKQGRVLKELRSNLMHLAGDVVSLQRGLQGLKGGMDQMASSMETKIAEVALHVQAGQVLGSAGASLSLHTAAQVADAGSMEAMLRSAFANASAQGNVHQHINTGNAPTTHGGTHHSISSHGADSVSIALALLGSMEGAAMAEAAQQRQLAAVTKQALSLVDAKVGSVMSLVDGALRAQAAEWAQRFGTYEGTVIRMAQQVDRLHKAIKEWDHGPANPPTPSPSVPQAALGSIRSRASEGLSALPTPSQFDTMGSAPDAKSAAILKWQRTAMLAGFAVPEGSVSSSSSSMQLAAQAQTRESASRGASRA